MQFYSPVEIVRGQTQCLYSQEDMERYKDAFKVAQPAEESLAERKLKVIQWLKKLPLSDRQLVVAYTHKQSVCLLRRAYQINLIDASSKRFALKRDSNSNFRLEQMPSYLREPSERSQAQKRLLEQACCLSKYTHCDTLTVSDSLLENVDLLYSLFELVQAGVAQELSDQDCQALLTQQDPAISLLYEQNDHSRFKNLALWLADLLAMQLSLNYYKWTVRALELEQGRARLKEYAKVWKSIDRTLRLALMQKIIKKPLFSLIQEHSNILKVEKINFPSTYGQDEVSTQKQLLELVGCHQRDVFYSLRKMSLEESFEGFGYYKFELADELEASIANQADQINRANKKGGANAPKKKNHKRLHLNLQLGTPTLSKVQHIRKLQQVPQHPPILSQTIISQPEPVMIQAKAPAKQRKPEIKFIFPSSQPSKKPKINFRSKESNAQMISESSARLAQRSLSQQFMGVSAVQSRKLGEDFYQSQQTTPKKNRMDQDRVKQDIIAMVYSNIQEQARETAIFRKIALNRVIYVLRGMNLSCRAYGSSVCGLALKDSDIDILVDPAIVNLFYMDINSYRQKIVKSLELLQRVFAQTGWASEFKLLPNALVPLLTFTAKPEVYFQHENCRMKLNLKKKPSKDIAVLVDITIEPYMSLQTDMSPHLGMAATQLMKSWLTLHSLFLPVVAICKQLLRRHGLKNSYTGGISSFTLSVLAVAFFKQFFNNPPASRCWSLRETLTGFIRFVQCIDEVRTLIDLSMEQPYKLMPVESSPHKIVVLNPLNNKNLMENCYRLDQIKALLQKLAETDTPKQLMHLLFQTE